MHTLVSLFLFILKKCLSSLNFRHSGSAVYSTKHWTEPTGKIAYAEVSHHNTPALFSWCSLWACKGLSLCLELTFSHLVSLIPFLIKTLVKKSLWYWSPDCINPRCLRSCSLSHHLHHLPVSCLKVSACHCPHSDLRAPNLCSSGPPPHILSEFSVMLLCNTYKYYGYLNFAHCWCHFCSRLTDFYLAGFWFLYLTRDFHTVSRSLDMLFQNV